MQPQPLGLSPSFGFGDRMGLATGAHVAALKRDGAGISPIFAQQSVREMSRTYRTPAQVIRDALLASESAGWTGPQGADADHLKTRKDIDQSLAAGFSFFTIDPSEEVDGRADRCTFEQLRELYGEHARRVGWIDRFLGKMIRLAAGTNINLTEEVVLRAAGKYGRAVHRAGDLCRHLVESAKLAGRGCEIELSVDETSYPTTSAEHWIIASELRDRGVKLVSLAPRFVGEFEKAVDFKGDLAAFERSLADHAAIARELGPYKLSLHSGSDKLSIYPALARLTSGRFHVKTAGTTWLETLRVVARHNDKLFRRIVELARRKYESDRVSYHVSASLDAAPTPSDETDARKLEKIYLDLWDDTPAGRGFTAPGRQVLHCTYGSVLSDVTLRSQIIQVIKEHRDTCESVLVEHFGRHLRALAAGM